MNPGTINLFIKQQENAYDTQEISLSENWSWSMRNHLSMSFNFIHGMFTTGENNWKRMFKKIIQPILNFRYAAEDIEVKDILLYVEDPQGEHLSFLIKKYHDEVYVKENNLDQFIDRANEEDIDYGGVLLQKVNNPAPEVLPLLSIAFCDQTNLLGGPIGFKHYFSPSKLRTMEKFGWGNPKNGANTTIADLIQKSSPEKASTLPFGAKKNETPGKNIEVYVVRGDLPAAYLDDKGDFENWFNQVQIVAFYTPKDKAEKDFAILYRKKDTEGALKFFSANKEVYGRALSVGGAEELFHPQIWTNWLEIHKVELLRAASKVPLYTDDPSYQNRNRITDMKNLEITTIQDGKVIRQIPTAAPVNIRLFAQTVNEYYENAQQIASAFNPLLGQPAPSGTPFRAQERQVIQGRGPHDRRRGKFAKFIEEVYRDWIIPHIVREILKGKEFLVSLSSEELQWVTEKIAENRANREINEAVLSGRKLPLPNKEVLKQQFLSDLSKKGSKWLLGILKDEFADAEIKISIVIGTKQKDLSAFVDKLVNIMRQVIAAPQILQDPLMRKLFDKVLSASGLDPVDFAVPTLPVQPQALPAPELPELTREAIPA